MSDPTAPVLLQVCANDHPPFADICRFHAAAAAALGWDTRTVMLKARGAEPDPDFQYAGSEFARRMAAVLAGRQPVLTLCHRYRAYRAVVTSAAVPAPVVAVAHEFQFFGRRRRRWQLRWDRLRGRPPVAFAGVSDAVAEELAEVTGETVLLPNGIDLAQADAARLSKEAAWQQLGVSPAAFNVAVVGRLHPKKNPGLAVDAFALAAADMPGASLVFVGDGELAADLAGRAEGLPVTFAGFVPGAARLLAAFDLVLVPSGEREAFGMAALEAMAAGVPVLCGPAPGPRFVVGDSGYRFGYGFAADDPRELARALSSVYRAWCSGTLSERARRARARVEAEFSVTAAAGRLQALAVTQ